MNLESTILNLWTVSRTALAGGETVPTRYDRMVYVKNALQKYHADLISRLSPKHLWLAIEDATAPTKPLS